MTTTTALKYLSIATTIFGAISTQGVISGIPMKWSVTVIGLSAALFKICDAIENKLALQPSTNEKKPVIPADPPSA